MTKKNSILFAILSLAMMISGCASLHSVSMTRIPSDRSTPISSESSTWAVLGLYFSNDFVDEGIEKLRDQCKGGKVSGVFTKYSGRIYFLWTTRKVELKAFCERGSKGA